MRTRASWKLMNNILIQKSFVNEICYLIYNLLFCLLQLIIQNKVHLAVISTIMYMYKKRRVIFDLNNIFVQFLEFLKLLKYDSLPTRKRKLFYYKTIIRIYVFK